MVSKDTIYSIQGAFDNRSSSKRSSTKTIEYSTLKEEEKQIKSTKKERYV